MNELEGLLKGDWQSEPLVSKAIKSGEYSRIIDVKVLYGNDDYQTTNYYQLNEKDALFHNKQVKTPNRVRGLGGVIITFSSENGTTWSKRLLFHKGMVYESEVGLGWKS